MTRFLLCGSVLLGSLAWAQRPPSPDDCDDNFAECKEDCTITYGGTTNDKARAKVNKCLKKCNGAELECRERFFETKRNGLDEGSLKDSPGSRRVDEDGLPNKAASKKQEEPREARTKVSESPPPKQAREEDLRDDRPRDEPPPKAEKKKADPPPSYELKPEETPKSNRSQISKVDPKSEPKRAEVKEEPAPRPEEPKKTSGLDRDVREEDNAPAKRVEKRDEPPPRREEPKKVEKKDEKKKQKALDEWDPDAL